VKGRRHARITSVSVFVRIEGKECVKSTQGDMRTAPAGMGRLFESRIKHNKDSAIPAPALSPPIVSFDGSTALCWAPGGGSIR
jgi:hypothetical protein